MKGTCLVCFESRLKVVVFTTTIVGKAEEVVRANADYAYCTECGAQYGTSNNKIVPPAYKRYESSVLTVYAGDSLWLSDSKFIVHLENSGYDEHRKPADRLNCLLDMCVYQQTDSMRTRIKDERTNLYPTTLMETKINFLFENLKKLYDPV